MTLLRYLLLPAQPAGLIFIAFETLGFSLCSFAGLMGLPVLLALLSWAFSYGYVLLEQVAHGARDPPVLSIEMINPLSQLRPLLHLAVALLLLAALWWLSTRVGLTPALFLGACALAALPASIAVLAVGDAAWQALDPRALWRLARALGFTYLMLIALTVLCGLGLASLGWFNVLPDLARNALALYAWLALFALVGGALYEHRDAVGLEATYSPENRGRGQAQQQNRERERWVDGVFAQARNGNLVGAWAAVEADLAQHQHARARYDWLLERLSAIDDQRLASRLAQDYIPRLLNRDNGRVVDIARERLARHESFRPRTAAETLRVAELMRLAGERGGARRLLSDFPTAFAAAPQFLKAAAQREIAQLGNTL